MRKDLILTAKPSITQKEIDYVTDAIKNCHGERWGDYVHRFEKQFAEYLGVKHAMTTSSCTGALHLGLKALGIGEGDEVIVPDTSWIATASSVVYVGAIPVFADVLMDTWCISPLSIEKLITKHTKAIMPVHLYGHPCDMTEIKEIASEYGLKIIEDAAPSLGAQFNGKKTGTFGDVAGFSFQGAKIASTGEGGMLVTNDDEIFERAQHFANHGRSSTGFDISDIGFKYKMSNLQAAWGCAQLERIDELVARRRKIFQWYYNELSGIAGLRLNKTYNQVDCDEEDVMCTDYVEPIYWMTSIVLDNEFGISRDDLMAKLKRKMIDTRPFFPPMSSFKMFKNAKNPVAKHIGANGINLPSFHDITPEEVIYICECIKDILWI